MFPTVQLQMKPVARMAMHRSDTNPERPVNHTETRTKNSDRRAFKVTRNLPV